MAVGDTGMQTGFESAAFTVGFELFDTVDVEQVADVAAAVAAATPRLARMTVAGPEVHDLRALGRIWREATGHRAIEIPLPLPDKFELPLTVKMLPQPVHYVRNEDTIGFHGTRIEFKRGFDG